MNNNDQPRVTSRRAESADREGQKQKHSESEARGNENSDWPASTEDEMDIDELGQPDNDLTSPEREPSVEFLGGQRTHAAQAEADNEEEIDGEWHEIALHKWEDRVLQAGTTVELENTEFLKIESIKKNSGTGVVKLQGLILVRSRKLRGVLPDLLNEVCFLLRGFADDPRLLKDTSIYESYLDDVVGVRSLVETNAAYPAFNESIEDSNLDNTGSEQLEEIKKGWTLVVRRSLEANHNLQEQTCS